MRHLFFSLSCVLLCAVPVRAQGLWVPDAGMLVARSAHVAVDLGNGEVLVTGGIAGGGEIGVAELYSFLSKQWRATCGPMSQPRQRHTATRLADGRVLIAGGSFLGLPLTSVEIFDPQSGAFSVAPPLAFTREGHTATLLVDGRVFVVGGQMPGTLPVAEIYDPATNSWSSPADAAFLALTVGNFRFHTAGILGATVNREVLVCGGMAPGSGLALATSFRYDPLSDTFYPGPALGTARFGHRMVAPLFIANTPYLIIGGTGPGGTALRSCELYQAPPGSEAFVPTGSLNQPRAGHTATWILEGVVVMGGLTGVIGSPALPTIETFNATSQTWALGTPIPVARGSHAAVAVDRFTLNPGAILVTGGVTNGGTTGRTDTYLGTNAVHARVTASPQQPVPGPALVYDILVANLRATPEAVQGLRALNGTPFGPAPSTVLSPGQVVLRGNIPLGPSAPIVSGLNYLQVYLRDPAPGGTVKASDFLSFCVGPCPNPCGP